MGYINIILRNFAIVILLGGLSACNGVLESSAPKQDKPIPQALLKKMKTRGMKPRSPILIRIYKDEDLLEVWKPDKTGKFALLTSYEICKWSGKLGPKFKEGDRQAPEGFYHVTPGLMNPNSSYHLSFNMGYPNTYDRANNRTGSFLMIHGACSSAGCYSMTDEYVEEIYALAREAFKGGQKSFQIQAYPFRLTPENMAKNINHKDFKFWVMLKEGNDYFEITGQPPKVDVCEKRYVFNREVEKGSRFNSREVCPPAKMKRSLALAFNEKQNKDQKKFDRLLKTSLVSPFVKPEVKPLVRSASIKAVPTKGTLEVIQPVFVPMEKKYNESKDELPATGETSSPDTVTAVPVASPFKNNSAKDGIKKGSQGPEYNPISAEVSQNQQPSSQIPVPQSATR